MNEKPHFCAVFFRPDLAKLAVEEKLKTSQRRDADAQRSNKSSGEYFVCGSPVFLRASAVRCFFYATE
ncbi:MAG: hypothetical protein V4447_16240 [Pseudomonadota bacterium]